VRDREDYMRHSLSAPGWNFSFSIVLGSMIWNELESQKQTSIFFMFRKVITEISRNRRSRVYHTIGATFELNPA